MGFFSSHSTSFRSTCLQFNDQILLIHVPLHAHLAPLDLAGAELEVHLPETFPVRFGSFIEASKICLGLCPHSKNNRILDNSQVVQSEGNKKIRTPSTAHELRSAAFYHDLLFFLLH